MSGSTGILRRPMEPAIKHRVYNMCFYKFNEKLERVEKYEKKVYNECKRKKRKMKKNRLKVLVENHNRIASLQAISDALIDEIEEEDPTGLFIPKLERQETYDAKKFGYKHYPGFDFSAYDKYSTCRCVHHCASLYCDFVNVLASEDRESLELKAFEEKYKETKRMTCGCSTRSYVLALVEKEFSIEVQTKSGYFSSMLFGETTDVSSIVDDKISKVSTVLNQAASNIKLDLKPEAKAYIDLKFAKLESMASNAKVQLTVPDVTGVGNILSKLFDAENVGYSVVTIFCVLYLTRKYHPNIGDICALFAGMAMCYVGSTVIMPILLSWLNPTPQSAGEWIRVVSEVIGISMFAAKGKWELNLQSILANFTAIEREKPLLEQLLERMQNLVFSIIRLVAEACGKEFISDWSPMAEKIRFLRKRVNNISKDPSRYQTPSVGYVNDVFKLQEDIMEIYEDVSVTKGHERYVMQINGLINIMKPLCEYLEVNKFTSGSRFGPFVRTLTGFSGVGKTAISEELNRECFEEYATEDMKIACANDYSRICYPVKSGQKYFESYNCQFILQVNDWLQKREKLGDEFSATEFIIQACGNSEQKLSAAGVKKKDKIVQASLVVDISTNVYCVNKVTCPTVQDAIPINRRLAGVNNTGFPCIMAINEKYGMEIEIPDGDVFPTPPSYKPKNYFKLTLDMSKVPVDKNGDKDFTNVYEFYDWSFTKGQLLKGYRQYNLAEYKAEFKRRFGIHYANQIAYLRSAARRGVVSMINLPKDVVVQGKSCYEDLCNVSSMKTAYSAELFDSVMNDVPAPMYDSEEEFERLRLSQPVLFEPGYGDDSDYEDFERDEEVVPVPFFDEEVREIVEEELCASYDNEPERLIVAAMADTIRKPELGLQTEGLNIKQRRAIKGWSMDELKMFVKCKMTDPMVYAVRRAMSYGMLFSKALALASFSLICVLEKKAKVFADDALIWFKDHPFISATLAGVAALSIYKLVSVSISFFKSFCSRSTPTVAEFRGNAVDGYTPVYTNEKFDPSRVIPVVPLAVPVCDGSAGFEHSDYNSGYKCCAPVCTPDSPPMAVPMAKVLDSVVTQGAIPGDKKWEYANATLENYYTFWVRYTYVNPDGTKIVKVEDECKCFALRGHLHSLHYHILRHMISTSRLKHCKSVEFGLTPVLTSSTPSVWYEYNTIRWIVRNNSVARDEVWFQMPSGTKIHGSLVNRMPIKDPEYLKILRSGRFPVKFYRSVGRSTPMNAVLTKSEGNYRYPIPTGVAGTVEEDLLEEAVTDMDGFAIDIETQGGDCASPCFMWSNSFTHLSARHKVFQHPFVVYRHSAWTNLLKFGFGGALYQEDYDWIEPYVLTLVKAKDRVASIEENIANMVAIANSTTGQSKSYVPYFKSPDVTAPIADHHIPVGSIDEVRINRKNNIKRSELFHFIKKEYGKDGKLTKMPTNLNPTDKGDPLILGIQNYGGNTDIKVNPLEVDVVTDFIVSDIINNSSPITDEMRGLIDIPTAIKGGGGLRGLNRKSGIGPSLTYVCKLMEWDPVDMKNCFGKEGEYDFDNPMSKTFVNICQDGLDRAKQGEALPVLFQNHLKVECKEGDKVRLFHGADKTSVPIFVSAFGELIKWIVQNRIKNGILIGCNPAKDWPIMYAHLTSVGEYGFAADFSKFDKFQIWILLNVLMVLARAFYGIFDPTGNLAREAIFECLKNPAFVLAFGSCSCVYSWQHGNCSGNFLTTLINCLSGIFIIYYSCFKILRAHSDFDKTDNHGILCFIRDNIRYEVMGDDNIIVLGLKLRNYVNWYNYQAAVFDNFHMELTDDQKGRRIGFVIPLHTHILEFSILGRGIKFVDGCVVAPLRDSSLFESMAWYKGKDRDPNNLLLNVERVLAELSARGRKEYSLNARKLANAAYEKLGVYPRRNTTFEAAFAAYHSLKFPEYNLYQEGDEDQEEDLDPIYKKDPLFIRDMCEESKEEC